MLVEKIPVSLWMLAFALIGSGIDYLRTKQTDKKVLCFFALVGLAAGGMFRWAGLRWGDAAGLAAGVLTAAAACLISRQFLLDYIVRMRRDAVSDDEKESYLEFQEEVEKERQSAAPGGEDPSLQELLRATKKQADRAQNKRRR